MGWNMKATAGALSLALLLAGCGAVSKADEGGGAANSQASDVQGADGAPNGGTDAGTGQYAPADMIAKVVSVSASSIVVLKSTADPAEMPNGGGFRGGGQGSQEGRNGQEGQGGQAPSGGSWKGGRDAAPQGESGQAAGDGAQPQGGSGQPAGDSAQSQDGGGQSADAGAQLQNEGGQSADAGVQSQDEGGQPSGAVPQVNRNGGEAGGRDGAGQGSGRRFGGGMSQMEFAAEQTSIAIDADTRVMAMTRGPEGADTGEMTPADLKEGDIIMIWLDADKKTAQTIRKQQFGQQNNGAAGRQDNGAVNPQNNGKAGNGQ